MNVYFVVGQNGVGKSQFLLKRAYEDTVFKSIVICNSIHDRFIPSPKIKRLSAKNSMSLPNNVMKKAIMLSLSEGPHKLSDISRTLIYCGYQPVITVTVKPIRNRDEIFESRFNNDNSSGYIINEIMNHGSESLEFDFDFGRADKDFNFRELSILNEILRSEGELRGRKIIKPIEISLHKINGGKIPLAGASSGELSLITSFIYILCELDGAEQLLIDEPENSLHPQWQKEYVSKLVGLIGYREVKIFIATHSPLIVSGAQLEEYISPSFYHPESNEWSKSSSINIEATLWEQFETIGPKSTYLSEKIVTILDEFQSRKRSFDETISEINLMEKGTFDKSQTLTFKAAVGLAKAIAQELKNA
ncbi:TPA: ATP-binding protein [Citrobacter amalonaticus]|uniref:AAA family ATPase n=1 Tax=Citrobacter europaeus TaxID=1914243 RepID=UPI00069424C9|nr:ATP-binding protein [Citrobacter koseri]HCC6169035.1 ATP-binding protein [Citrobacter amalonaticus]HCC6296508.1 ATP-binding protein [Citrobacter amalonaticus]HCC6432428.1 ATP-binding protein [Citrobacter amalonaticus]HCC7018505.1 ATP-binding protein [Citrobacter amalonaticus]